MLLLAATAGRFDNGDGQLMGNALVRLSNVTLDMTDAIKLRWSR